jgi:putative SOS response-associated peptidase YedK
MCGRYTLTDKDIGTVANALGAIYDEELEAAHKPRFNIAPTQPAPIVRLEADGARHLRLASFGHFTSRLLLNVRAETADRRPDVRAAFAARRCIVPADGFFEWQGEKSARQPIWFHPRAGGLLFLAGIWEPPPAAKSDKPPAFMILTTAPNAVVSPVHDRMPVILAHDAALAYLASPDTQLLRTAPDDLLVATPVSSRVNDARVDDPDCLAPPPPGPPVGQLRLV